MNNSETTGTAAAIYILSMAVIGQVAGITLSVMKDGTSGIVAGLYQGLFIGLGGAVLLFPIAALLFVIGRWRYARR